LVGNPELLILDEPSSGLDPQGIKQVREIVREETDRGATIFFSSHHLEQVEKICNRVGIMRDGSLTTVADIDALRKKMGTNIIEVTVESFPDKAQVCAIAGVTNVKYTDSNIELTCEPDAKKIQILNQLDGMTRVEKFTEKDISLESLFESLTNENANMDTDSEDRLAVSLGG